MLETIRRNIDNHGFHIYHVKGGPFPRLSYSIGLAETVGAEIVFAGGAFFEGDEPGRIMDAACRRLLQEANAGRDVADIVSGIFPVESLGIFTLRPAHDSWIRIMLLGALDYFGGSNIDACQIVPENKHWTLDVPDLSKARSQGGSLAWKWLDAPWPYEVPKDSLAMTNLLALRGQRISEAVRWEDGWHLYASQDKPVSDEDLRMLPLGVLLAADPSLEPVVSLRVGEALWRGPDNGEWEPWD